MNINRNNYEEYFLLYADNELSAKEKNIVELFVQQNIDLEEEFLMLQQTVINTDKHVVLEDKSFLLKEEKEEFINADNYTEKFILYNDNELNDDERLSTEKFIKESPSFKNEFDLLHRVKLQTEKSIVFPGKKLLYRKEDDGKVIPFKWWRAMAAAVLIGFGLWTGFIYIQKNEPTTRAANNANEKTKSTDKFIATDNSLVTKADNSEAKNNHVNQKAYPDTNKNILPVQVKSQRAPVTAAVKMKVPVKVFTKNKVIDKAIEQNNYQNNNITAAEHQTKNNEIENKSISDTEPVSGNIISSDEIITSAQANKYAKTVSYIEDINKPEDDNHIFYNVTTEKFNKSKLGGFLKKAKRIVERKLPFGRRAADNENEVAAN